MGARGQNFYNRLASPLRLRGGGDRRSRISTSTGKKAEATAAVPDALVDEVALVGDRARIADRLDAFRDCGATTLILQTRQPEAIRLLAELV